MPRVMRQGGPLREPVAPRLQSRLEPAELWRDALEDDAVVKRVAYTGTSFAGVHAEAFEAEGCRFEGIRFTGAVLRQSQISDSALATCDFAELRAHDVSLIRCTVSGSRITGSAWKSSTFRDVRFEGGKADHALFRECKLYGVAFEGVPMRGADFQRSEMRNVRFTNCDLTGAQFAHLVPGSVRFENCTLTDVGGAAWLRGVVVRGPGAMELAMSLAREAGIVFE
ncbi:MULTISPECIES: pentapeptide repeat-containing protein [unclassified Streptomyces]|uniref:pentapeptide repeat-containing protein n=1 Tax=unclassified Streptomyces TaxID=2593676 RepID=UPI00039CF614|nr:MULTISPECIES: pentapeptide repeat-containing protein [unclassified Streptomyces]MYY02693.1 pentapeptide repeat-containing protein [Streptomyces sp. SID4913]